MDQVVPWAGLLGLIEPFYPKAGGGTTLSSGNRAAHSPAAKLVLPERPSHGRSALRNHTHASVRASDTERAARRSTYSRLNKRSVLYKVKRKIEYCKAQTRAKVEHPFRVIKRQFGYAKVRFRGLMKNTA